MKNNSSRYKTISAIKVVEDKYSGLRSMGIWLIFLIVLGISSFSAYRLGGTISGAAPANQQLSELKQQVQQLDNEREKLSSTANSADNTLTIERATQKQLAAQVQTLTTENNKLKEDLAFFENLIPTTTAPEGIRIGAFKADTSNHSQIPYRLLVMQGGKNSQDFVGELQFVATVMQEGKKVTITFPDTKNGDAEKLKLSFKYYQRVEGVLTLPEGSVIKTLQARILNKGQLRTYQSLNL